MVIQGMRRVSGLAYQNVYILKCGPHREPGNGMRVFPYELDWPTNNTVDACLNQCAAFGYPVAGLEYGEQCCEFVPFFSCLHVVT